VPVLFPRKRGIVEKKTYLKEQCESDPLVVGDVSPLVLLVRTGLEDSGVSNLIADVEREGPRDGVGGVDPTVQVEDIVRHVVGVNAVYGVADVLPGRHDHREGEQDHRANTPVEAEHGGVDVDVADLDQRLESDEYVEHGGGEIEGLPGSKGRSSSRSLAPSNS